MCALAALLGLSSQGRSPRAPLWIRRHFLFLEQSALKASCGYVLYHPLAVAWLLLCLGARSSCASLVRPNDVSRAGRGALSGSHAGVEDAIRRSLAGVPRALCG